MASSVLAAFLLLSLPMLARAQVFLAPGACPSASPKTNFSAENFMGVWYETASIPNVLEESADRISFDLKSIGKTNNVSLDVYMYRSSKKAKIAAVMTPSNSSAADGTYIITFTLDNETISGSIMILDTDYKSYAVVWACEVEKVMGIDITKQWAWILGRQKTGMLDTKNLAVLASMQVPPYLVKETVQCSEAMYLGTSLLTACLSFALSRVFT